MQFMDTLVEESEDPPDSKEEAEKEDDDKSKVVYKLKTSEPDERDYEIYKKVPYELFVFDWETLNTFTR